MYKREKMWYTNPVPVYLRFFLPCGRRDGYAVGILRHDDM